MRGGSFAAGAVSGNAENAIESRAVFVVGATLVAMQSAARFVRGRGRSYRVSGYAIAVIEARAVIR